MKNLSVNSKINKIEKGEGKVKKTFSMVELEANAEGLKKVLNEIEEQVDRIVSKMEKINSLSEQLESETLSINSERAKYGLEPINSVETNAILKKCD
jgi:K+/H+ antiporter YhaU regulatory subunit KhtT